MLTFAIRLLMTAAKILSSDLEPNFGTRLFLGI